ncbi:MAG TPA: cytochrome c family protein, partial [Planctomycetota bacterium]|nr:cytochrome c family protein [Planctomycetota bacterium]
ARWEKIEAKHKYIGVAACKDCHDKKTASKAYEKWAAEPHSKAFENLGSDKAKEIAKARGIADPQKAPECLRCHTAGHGNEERWFGKRFTLAEGVSCEACHGPGGDYEPKAVHGKAERRAEAIERGFVPAPEEKACRNCHNTESPTFEKFDYKEYRKKILHWAPRDIDK